VNVINEQRSLRQRSINWRQEYIHIAIVLLTTCWLAAWITLTLNWFIDISLPTTLGLTGAHLLGSTLVVRWSLHRRLDNTFQLVIAMLVTWLAVGITLLLMPSLARAYGGNDPLTLNDLFHFDRQQRVPAGPVVVIWVLFLWWRGSQLGNAYMTVVRASFGMRLGILMLLIVSLFAAHSLRTDILALVPFFFFFGLLGTSLARADSLNLDRTQRTTTFGRGWILSLIGLTLLVTLGGYLAALWLAGMNFDQFLKTLSTIGEGALNLFFLILSPVLFLSQIIYNLIKSVMPDKMPGTILETGSGGGEPDNRTYAPWLADLLSILSNTLLILIVAMLVVLLLALIWFLVVARLERTPSDVEERETLGTSEVVGSLRDALRDRWRQIAAALGFFRQFGLGRNLFAALSIRRIYARMEKLAGKRGYPRVPSETPYEYRRELYQAFPGQNEAIQHITEAYIAVRYGEVPESVSELEAVRAAWEQLQASTEPTTE
jgi:hypothetical protein